MIGEHSIELGQEHMGMHDVKHIVSNWSALISATLGHVCGSSLSNGPANCLLGPPPPSTPICLLTVITCLLTVNKEIKSTTTGYRIKLAENRVSEIEGIHNVQLSSIIVSSSPSSSQLRNRYSQSSSSGTE